ncbi:MAG: ABC transporter substrate-binding protein [Betaproteobacteria bacterium]|jgi:phospholipid transport system substrate-binding protein|nr:MAG: ABC transporter substrate-binding protein [Betaproteobacteria bacterium]
MHHRLFTRFAASLVLCLAASAAVALDEAPDTMIKRLSDDVVGLAKDTAIASGDASKIMDLVDTKVMPNVDFTRMTASAVGRTWRQATPEQQLRLQQEFKTLLVRTYAGALSQVKDLAITVKPLRAGASDTEVVVRTLIKGHGEPIQLDYRLEKSADGWKIYDLNVLGVWLVEAYRGQFLAEIQSKGIDGLIATLAARNNKSATKGS